MNEQLGQPDYPYLHKGTEREPLELQLPVQNLPEYAIAGQYHPIDGSNERILVPGIVIESRDTVLGRVAIYRDPISGEIYRAYRK